MKNLMKIAALAIVAVLMCACGGSNTPSGVAEKAVKCLQNEDYEGYVDLVYVQEKEGKDMKQEKAQLVALMTAKFSETLKKRGGLKSYEVLSEEISEDGNTAKVKMRIEYGDKTDEDTIKLRKDDKGNWKIDNNK